MTYPPVQDEAACRLPDPAQLRAVPAPRLRGLAVEIRAFLIDHVCTTGGHLGPNLGVVELTLALHRVFDSPRDILIFVSHVSLAPSFKTLAGHQTIPDQGPASSGPPSRSRRHCSGLRLACNTWAEEMTRQLRQTTHDTA